MHKISSTNYLPLLVPQQQRPIKITMLSILLFCYLSLNFAAFVDKSGLDRFLVLSSDRLGLANRLRSLVYLSLTSSVSFLNLIFCFVIVGD